MTKQATATIKKGNKIARITGTEGAYRVVVALVSDISDYGDVLISKTFKTFKGASQFSTKELA